MKDSRDLKTIENAALMVGSFFKDTRSRAGALQIDEQMRLVYIEKINTSISFINKAIESLDVFNGVYLPAKGTASAITQELIGQVEKLKDLRKYLEMDHETISLEQMEEYFMQFKEAYYAEMLKDDIHDGPVLYPADREEGAK